MLRCRGKEASPAIHRFPLQKLIEIDRSGLHHFVRFGQPGQASDFTGKFTRCLMDMDGKDTWIGSYFCLEVAVSALQFLKESEGSENRHIDDVAILEKKINDVSCYEDAVEFITEVLEAVTRFREQFNNRYARKMMKAKEFIHAHSDRPELSLQIVADHVGMSPSYFSTIFSQETGQTFIEFLTSVRMERAIGLIRTTNFKTYEIANLVGYTDAHYFSFLFKKFTGRTTREFRKKNRRLLLKKDESL